VIGRAALPVALALLMASRVAAQVPEPIVFADQTFDVTGAGTFAAGDLDAVLQPYYDPSHDVYLGRLEFELVVDRSGAVLACRNADDAPLGDAALAMCDHLRAKGRFTLDPLLVLDFTKATYRMTSGTRYKPAPEEPKYRVFDTAYRSSSDPWSLARTRRRPKISALLRPISSPCRSLTPGWRRAKRSRVRRSSC
jgi:hypothetical protein